MTRLRFVFLFLLAMLFFLSGCVADSPQDSREADILQEEEQEVEPHDQPADEEIGLASVDEQYHAAVRNCYAWLDENPPSFPVDRRYVRVDEEGIGSHFRIYPMEYEEGKEELLDETDLVIYIGDFDIYGPGDGHYNLCFVCDSETHELIGRIPLA